MYRGVENDRFRKNKYQIKRKKYEKKKKLQLTQTRKENVLSIFKDYSLVALSSKHCFVLTEFGH